MFKTLINSLWESLNSHLSHSLFNFSFTFSWCSSSSGSRGVLVKEQSVQQPIVWWEWQYRWREYATNTLQCIAPVFWLSSIPCNCNELNCRISYSVINSTIPTKRSMHGCIFWALRYKTSEIQKIINIQENVWMEIPFKHTLLPNLLLLLYNRTIVERGLKWSHMLDLQFISKKVLNCNKLPM